MFSQLIITTYPSHPADALPRSPKPLSSVCSFSIQKQKPPLSSARMTPSDSTNDTSSRHSGSSLSSPEIIDRSEVTDTGPTSQSPSIDMIDFSSTLDSTTLQLRKQVPRQLVVTMFQQMVSTDMLFFNKKKKPLSDVLCLYKNVRKILFTEGCRLEGMVTKRDITRLLTGHFDHAAALYTPNPSSPSQRI